MKQLNSEIRKNGFTYKQVAKTDKGYIYCQIMNNKIIAYEVFEHKENKLYNTVSFPGNEAFGLWAWTYRTLDEAKNKLQTI